MTKTIGETRLLVFNNEQMPCRGIWTIRSSSVEVGFTACRQIVNSSNQCQAMEVVALKTIEELNAFCATLVQQGWSTSLNKQKFSVSTKMLKAPDKGQGKGNQQVTWEKHRQDIPQALYKPISVEVLKNMNRENVVKYSNDI
jgi:hypothetical protein